MGRLQALLNVNWRGLKHPQCLKIKVMWHATSVVCEIALSLALVMDQLLRIVGATIEPERDSQRKAEPVMRPEPIPGHMGF